MLRGTEEAQTRILARVGAVAILLMILTAVFISMNPFGGRPTDRISVALDTPYVGQGIKAGSAVVLHGVEVGQVTDVASTPGGDVRLITELRTQPLVGLTDAMTLDFRPINYFGVPGINVIPGEGGRALKDGTQISVSPKGNFTLSELLSRLGDVSQSALTPQLITVADRITRYTDAFNPLFETIVIATTAVADVQTTPTELLLSNAASISAAFPSYASALIDTGTRQIDYNYPVPPLAPSATGPRLEYPFLQGTKAPNLQDYSEDYYQNTFVKFNKISSEGLFAAVGKLEASHVDDLLPLIDSLKGLTDTAPTLLRPGDLGQTMAEARSRLEALYGGNGQQRALQVRLLLDSLPGVAAPLGVTGGPDDVASSPPPPAPPVAAPLEGGQG